ncbi:MAG: hypothetical protein HY313_09130 [Acidobacteria bacterium]|nr:hypothetical protein [Acidobacteriota bacterium]
MGYTAFAVEKPVGTQVERDQFYAQIQGHATLICHGFDTRGLHSGGLPEQTVMQGGVL